MHRDQITAVSYMPIHSGGQPTHVGCYQLARRDCVLRVELPTFTDMANHVTWQMSGTQLRLTRSRAELAASVPEATAITIAVEEGGSESSSAPCRLMHISCPMLMHGEQVLTWLTLAMVGKKEGVLSPTNASTRRSRGPRCYRWLTWGIASVPWLM